MYEYQTADPCLYDKLKYYAKENRTHATEAESALWEFIRSEQLGKPFKRQHIIGDYIADFVCFPSKLIIELDGGYHHLAEQKEKDESRTEWLQKKGYKVIRFTNEEVLTDIQNTIKKIKENI